LSYQSCRPIVNGGRKKTLGKLSAHLNGVRYELADKSKVDVIYSNIKHCYFFPATKTFPTVLIHFQLHNPILIGKTKPKKTDFVQFSQELADEQHSVNDDRLRDNDVADDQKERELRKQWNQRFKNFAQEMTNHVRHKLGNESFDLEFELPISQQFMFEGKAEKQEMTPYFSTARSLVALLGEPVPVVIAIKFIECVIFERTQMNNRYFDATFVTKEKGKYKVTS
jgi:nucleosome binding factor SPN SPT16 subunit